MRTRGESPIRYPITTCLRWAACTLAPVRPFVFGESHERAQQKSPASDVGRLGLDAGDVGRRGRLAASSTVAGLDLVGVLSRRQRWRSCRHGDILRIVRAFDIRRQGQHGRIPCRSSAWLQLASSAALGRGPSGRRQLPRLQRHLHLHASLGRNCRLELPGVAARARESDRPCRLSRRSAGPYAHLWQRRRRMDEQRHIDHSQQFFRSPNIPERTCHGTRDQTGTAMRGAGPSAPASSAL